MVADTVKAFSANYPALLPLSPSLAYSSCSASLRHPPPSAPGAHQLPPYSPQDPPSLPVYVDQKPLLHGLQSNLGSHSADDENSSSGMSLGSNGMSLPSPLGDLNSSMRKKDLFSQRKQREFIPDSKKDESYWDRRRRNNEAAKRSREKRRFNDMILEQRVVELTKENALLAAQLNAIKERYGIQGENLINPDQVLATVPQGTDHIVTQTKRKSINSTLLQLSSPAVTSLLSPGGSSGPPLSPSPHYSDHLSSPPVSSPSSPQYSSYGTPPQHHQHPMDLHSEPRDYNRYSPHDQYNVHDDMAPSPEGYYDAALNLSRSSQPTEIRSPMSPMSSISSSSPNDSHPNDIEMTMARRSPSLETSSCLPHKLRHKHRSHVQEKELSYSVMSLHNIKSEPRETLDADDSIGSSDERDSIISLTGPRTNVTGGRQDPVLVLENAQLRTELQRLASDVASLKDIIGRPRSDSDTDSAIGRSRSETDSDGSSR